MRKSRDRRRQAGLTLLELLFALLVGGILLTLTFNFFQNWQPMFQIEGTTRGASSLINRARMEAMRRNVTTVVEADVDTGTLFAYADVNGNSSPSSAAYTSYLVFDQTDATLAASRLDDYAIDRMQIPKGVHFGGPANGIQGADSVVGFTARPAHADPGPNVLVFDPLGRILAEGRYRFTRRNANHLEVAITSLGGSVEVRKFLHPSDRPTGLTGVDGFFARGYDTGGQVWKWY